VLLVCAACGRLGFEPGAGTTGDAAIGADGSIPSGDSLVPCTIPNLVGHWRFDETNGTIASDATGNGSDGILMNMDPVTDWVPGVIGNGLDFDGIDDRVVVAMPPALANLGPGTWAFWTTVRAIDGTFLYKSDDNFEEGWWVDVNTANGGIGFAGVHDGNNLRRYTSMYTMNAWTHVAITWDGVRMATGASIYIGGALATIDGTSTAAQGAHGDDTMRDLFIGGGGQGSNYNLSGTIDELRIYNRVLSQLEIAQLPICQ
jgi:hypothetical protein